MGCDSQDDRTVPDRLREHLGNRSLQRQIEVARRFNDSQPGPLERKIRYAFNDLARRVGFLDEQTGRSRSASTPWSHRPTRLWSGSPVSVRVAPPNFSPPQATTRNDGSTTPLDIRRSVTDRCGIEDGATAYAKIRAGARLVQLYTALVYNGPGLFRRIRDDLADLLAADGLARIEDAVGLDADRLADR